MLAHDYMCCRGGLPAKIHQIGSAFKFIMSHLSEEFTPFTLPTTYSPPFYFNAIKAHYWFSNVYANRPSYCRKSGKLLDLKQEIAFK